MISTHAVIVAAMLCGQMNKESVTSAKDGLSVKDIVSIRYAAFEYETMAPVTRQSMRKGVEVLPKFKQPALSQLVQLLQAKYPAAVFEDGRVRLRVATKKGGELFVTADGELWRGGRGWKMDKRSYHKLVSLFSPEWDGLPPG